MSKNTSFPWCLLIKFQLLLILCAVVIFVVMVYVIGIKGSCEPYKSAEWSGEQCLDQGDESYYEYCEEVSFFDNIRGINSLNNLTMIITALWTMDRSW